jgi:hypothetical protein
MMQNVELTRKALVGIGAIALLLVAMVTVWAAVGRAQQPPQQKGGVAAFGWDIDNDGDYDTEFFASVQASGAVLMDEFTVPACSDSGPRMLGAGHGKWSFDPKTQVLLIQTLHADKDTGKGVWVVEIQATQSSDKWLKAFAIIGRLASVADWPGPPFSCTKAEGIDVAWDVAE